MKENFIGFFEGERKVDEFQIPFQRGVINCEVKLRWHQIHATVVSCGRKEMKTINITVGISKEEVTNFENTIKATIGISSIFSLESTLTSKRSISLINKIERTETSTHEFTSEKCDKYYYLLFQLVREYHFTINYFHYAGSSYESKRNHIISEYLSIFTDLVDPEHNSPQCKCPTSGKETEKVFIKGNLDNIAINYGCKLEDNKIKLWNTTIAIPKIPSYEGFEVKIKKQNLPTYIQAALNDKTKNLVLHLNSIEKQYLEKSIDKEKKVGSGSALLTLLTVGSVGFLYLFFRNYFERPAPVHDTLDIKKPQARDNEWFSDSFPDRSGMEDSQSQALSEW